MMKKVMPCRKVLVVLDDVDNADQIEALVGKPCWFGPGSIIIITTRDEQVLKAHRVNYIHDINLLSQKEAICLFSMYAFGRESPNEGYEELSEEVIHYADGLPLTIKVLGSHLCGNTEREWENALERLKTIPLKETLEKLELSYDGLENDYKEIFLEVACILKGMEKKRAIRMLESCGLHAEHGLKVLEQKSLLTISTVNLDGMDRNIVYLQMHDHLEEMGKNIVRRLHPRELNKHSRLWIREEIEDILVNDLGTNATRSIILDYSELPSDVIMKGLRKMKKLRALCIDSNCPEGISDLVDQYLPNTLQSLHWYAHPFTYMRKTFQEKKLVHIDMPYSNITQLWEGGEKKKLNELKILVLENSNAKSFDMGMTPKLKILELLASKVNFLNIGSASCLEKLDISHCNDLVELNMPVECPKLKFFKLRACKVNSLNISSAPCLETLEVLYCKEFVELNMPFECPMLKFLQLPGSMVGSLNIGSATCLETLNLESCEELVKLHMPVQCPKLKFLYLSNCKVGSLNIGSAPCLETLNLESCEELVKLHMPVECPKLNFLHLSNCKVGSLNIGSAPCLENLNLESCKELVKLHMPVEFPKLKFLYLSNCKVGSLNIGSAPCLETLNLESYEELVKLHMPVECPKLNFLHLSNCKVGSLNIGSAPCLETLNLESCKELVKLHMPVEFPKLKFLYLSNCKVGSLNIGSAPCLETLNLESCEELVKLHMPVECPKLNFLHLSNCKVGSLNIGSAPCLETLNLESCKELVKLHMPVEFPMLKFLYLSNCKVGSLNIGFAPCLETLNLESCEELVKLHMPVECPKLNFLHLSNCKVGSLNIGSAPCLEKLYLECCKDLVELNMPVYCPMLKFLALPGSMVGNLNIGSAPCLETLYLKGCKELVKLHMLVELPKLKFLDLSGSKVCNVNLELTPHLERLDLQNCYFLQEIHDPMGCLKNLVFLNLRGCLRLPATVHGYAVIMLNLTAESLDTCPLHPDSNLPKFQFKWVYYEDLTSPSGNFEKLLSSGLCVCTNLESFSATICGLQRLTELTLEGGIPEVPKDLHMLESLKHLTLSMKEIKHLPDSICMLKHLKSLRLRYCELLEQLPKDLGRLENLEELHLTDCISLRGVPNSTCNMKSLKYLDLHFCILVEKLPEEFGRLQSLEEINIEGAGIRRLPQSIFQLKGLYIVGSIWRLESYGFTSLKEISTYTASCYIRDSQHESILSTQGMI